MTEVDVKIDCSPMRMYQGRIAPYTKSEMKLLVKYCKPNYSNVIDRWLNYVEGKHNEIIDYGKLIMMVSFMDNIISKNLPEVDANLVSIYVKSYTANLQLDVTYVFDK